MTGDYLDVSLVDDELLAEVELTANLIVAAADSDGPLSAEAVDRLLFAGMTPEIPTQSRRPRTGPVRPRHGHRRAGAGGAPGR